VRDFAGGCGGSGSGGSSVREICFSRSKEAFSLSFGDYEPFFFSWVH